MLTVGSWKDNLERIQGMKNEQDFSRTESVRNLQDSEGYAKVRAERAGVRLWSGICGSKVAGI